MSIFVLFSIKTSSYITKPFKQQNGKSYFSPIGKFSFF